MSKAYNQTSNNLKYHLMEAYKECLKMLDFDLAYPGRSVYKEACTTIMWMIKHLDGHITHDFRKKYMDDYEGDVRMKGV